MAKTAQIDLPYLCSLSHWERGSLRIWDPPYEYALITCMPHIEQENQLLVTDEQVDFDE